MSHQKSVEEEKKEKEASKLIKEEKAKISMVWWTYVVFLSVEFLSLQVKLSVVWEYVKSCTITIVLFALLFNVAYNGCSVGSNIWLAKWSTDEDNGVDNMSLSTSVYIHAYMCTHMHIK